MRISTSTMFETGTAQLGTLQSQMAKTQQQMSANRRILTPADDPIASARALEVTQSQSMNTQYATNRQNARSSLSQVEQALGSVTSLLQDVKTLTVSAGNGSLTQSDREAMAIELSGRLEDLMGLANSADGAGGYLFAGYRQNTLPFTKSPTGADYNGDQGQRQLQVGSNRQLAISDSGAAVFNNAMTGNGIFETGAAAANTGTGIIAPGTVTDRSQITNHKYEIAFAVSGTPAVTTYTVTDNTLVPPVTGAAQPFQSGQSISFDGMTMDVKGAPADGDKFSVEPSQKQSLFTTVTDLIATLRGPSVGPLGQAVLSNGLNTAHSNIDAALENVLGVRASVGARLKEIDYLDSAGEDINIQYSATLSELQDLDMVKAVSLFTQQQFTLEAAQKSFKALSGLSLFNFL